MSILEYRPHLEYKRELKAVLHSYETIDEYAHLDDSGGDQALVNGPASERPSDKITGRGYIPTQIMKETVDLTGTDVLVGHIKTIEKIDATLVKIHDKIRENVTTGPTIDEYIKAREEKDAEKMYAFEDYHAQRIEGSTAAEVLPVLYRFIEEMEIIGGFVGSHLFPKELDQRIEYLGGQLDRLREEEAEKIRLWIEEDVNSALDEDRLKEENHILFFLHERITGINGFVEELEVLISDTPASVYHESGKRIGLLALQQDVLKKEFKKLNLRRFEKTVVNTSDANERMMRLVDPIYKRTLLEKVVSMQQEKLASRDALQALYVNNPMNEDDPMNIFLLDISEDIDEMKQESDALTEDLYKIIELERLQMNDYLVSIEKKNMCRHLYRILEGVSTIDPNVTDQEREVDRLLQ